MLYISNLEMKKIFIIMSHFLKKVYSESSLNFNLIKFIFHPDAGSDRLKEDESSFLSKGRFEKSTAKNKSKRFVSTGSAVKVLFFIMIYIAYYYTQLLLYILLFFIAGVIGGYTGKIWYEKIQYDADIKTLYKSRNQYYSNCIDNSINPEILI